MSVGFGRRAQKEGFKLMIDIRMRSLDKDRFRILGNSVILCKHEGML